MGGLIILTGLLISVLMWGNLKNIYINFVYILFYLLVYSELLMIIKK